MKARTLVLMLFISLMCITGFGQTTSDLTDNSTAEVHDAQDMDVLSIEAPVSVVTADFALVVHLDEAGTEGSFIPLSEKASEASLFLPPSVFVAENSNLTKEDLKVGWQLKNESLPHYDQHLIRQSNIDPGGVLSLFYI